MTSKKRVCVVGAGPSGMAALFHFAKIDGGKNVDVVLYEKQESWGGLWNYSWQTGTDSYGEPCHNGMYKHLWSNGPKECLEFPDYTFEKHFGKPIPSFPPRRVIRDYLEGRWTNGVDLRPYIKFNNVVRHVQYNETDDKFIVESTNLETEESAKEVYDYVVVATGIFNVPNVPDFPGIDTFEGKTLHSHNFRSALEFKGQNLLIIGSSYSAEDLALQCLKFGAKSVVCSWRTKPMGFNWPKGIEERQFVQYFEGKTAYFKDGSSADIDAVILCTGYKYSFPFMEDKLRLKSHVSFYPNNLYKGSLYLPGGNNKLFYVGIQDQFFSFTMFDVQALWICKYILGQIRNEPKSHNKMKENAHIWQQKCSELKTLLEQIDFQADFVGDLSKDSGYCPDAVKANERGKTWEQYKKKDILTYRDQCFTSIYTGNKSPKPKVPWWQAMDDSIKAFVD